VKGIVVGERGLRIDAPRRQKALRLTVLSIALMIVRIAGPLSLVHGLLALASLVPRMLGFLGAVWYGPAYGAFDSEVSHVAYSASVHAEADLETARTVAVWVGGAKVASASGETKSDSGRAFQAVVPESDERRDLPSTIRNEVVGRRRAVSLGRSATSR
jgi:hypothetical protein